VVYHARHVRTAEPIAIKVLLAESAREPRRRREFRREVQALAKIHHPSIAAVLDYGTIDNEVAAEGPSPMIQGAPWFAMEYIDGTPMRTASAGWQWPEIRSFLLQTLDALAHAHARSIVHRDLKPANILITDDEPANEPTIKLFDFGIAQLVDTESFDQKTPSKRVTGTPKYMAPEQIVGTLRDQGPWTDLYALGCLTWRLVCGNAPFDGTDTEDILEQQVERLAPDFAPQFPVHDRLEEWLRGLLRKDTDARTRRAADAAWELAQLGAPSRPGSPAADSTGEIPTIDPAHVQPTLSGIDETRKDVAPETERQTPLDDDTVDHAVPDGTDDRTPREEPFETAVPPVLPDWRREDEGRTAAVVPGAGLRLFSLREVPIVGRQEERDRLWHQLSRVRDDQRPRLVVLEGEVGAGKSRLAQWLCRRVHETGAAREVHTAHSRSAGPDEGLRTLFSRLFRTSGLSRGEVFERLVERLPATGTDDEMRLVDARALTELLRPTGEDDTTIEGPPYRFTSPGQKYALVRRLAEDGLDVGAELRRRPYWSSPPCARMSWPTRPSPPGD
ncbi:MAG: protein kinase, partial [Bradymonadaceae bacterium]